jgi:hypothetical protein
MTSVTRSTSQQFSLLLGLVLLLVVNDESSAQTPAWTPPSIVWYCGAQSGGETLCSLVARGVPPAATVNPTSASATYRIYKSKSLGNGVPVLTSVATMPCVARPNGEIECTAKNEVRLAPGVYPIYGTSRNTTDLDIYINANGPLFDWTGDGTVSASGEGLLLLRYLFGFRGAALTERIAFINAKADTEIESSIRMGLLNGWFNFNGQQTSSSAFQQGLLFVRCTLGLRNTALTQSTLVNELSATRKCEQIIAIN